MDEKEIRFIDLFGGIVGFRLGIQQASDNRGFLQNKKETKSIQGKPCDTKRKAGFTCVWYCDIDRYAVQIYNQRFNEHYEPTDITTVKTSGIPDFDMLTGGFPCQSFSIAGKRQGFKDTRGTLFFEICRIVKKKRPRLLFLENVKGLLSHDEGRTFATILVSLDELGYDVEWQVLNSRYFGVPQNRERVFIIGHLRGTGGCSIFPLRKNGEKNHRLGGAKYEQRKRVHGATLKGRKRDYGAGELLIVPKEVDTMINLHQWRTGEYGDGVKQGESFTLDNGCGRDYVIPIDKRIRRLTPVECERLQGFPDGWTEGISDTQRYKCLGNAVTVNVIQVIAETILKDVVEG